MPKKTKTKRNWLTGTEACERLGITQPTLRQYIAQGIIQTTQRVPSGKHHIPIASVERLLQEWAGK